MADQGGIVSNWGRMSHICINKLTIIGSDNGLSPEQHQVIIWINAGILLIGSLGTNFSEILSKIQIFSLMKIYLKMLSAKWRPFCPRFNVLIVSVEYMTGLIITQSVSPTIYSAQDGKWQIGWNVIGWNWICIKSFTNRVMTQINVPWNIS